MTNIYQKVEGNRSLSWDVVPEGEQPTEKSFVSEVFFVDHVCQQTSITGIYEAPYQRGDQTSRHYLVSKNGTISSECWIHGKDEVAIYKDGQIFTVPKWDLCRYGVDTPSEGKTLVEA